MVKELAKALIPPGMTPLMTWRLAVVISQALVLLHIAIACGWMAPFGLGTGFAQSVDVDSNRAAIEATRIDLLEDVIFKLQQQRCKIPPNQRGIYTERLQEKLRLYQKLTGRQYQLPACEDL